MVHARYSKVLLTTYRRGSGVDDIGVVTTERAERDGRISYEVSCKRGRGAWERLWTWGDADVSAALDYHAFIADWCRVALPWTAAPVGSGRVLVTGLQGAVYDLAAAHDVLLGCCDGEAATEAGQRRVVAALDVARRDGGLPPTVQTVTNGRNSVTL